MADDKTHDQPVDETEAEDAFFDDEGDEDAADAPGDADEEAWDEPPRPRRGTTMRHPVLLVLVIVGSIFMLVKTWPRAAYMLQAQHPAECGDLSARPMLRQSDPAALPPLTHDTHCHLTGHVQKLSILATGEPRSGDAYTSNAGRKYYLKLDGDKVIGVVAADRKDVVDYRLRRGNLLGFDFDTVGRMIDPDREPELRATAKTLRVKFGIADSEPIRIFDTTQQPGDRWPYALICVLMLFTALLATFGLWRILRARRAA